MIPFIAKQNAVGELYEKKLGLYIPVFGDDVPPTPTNKYLCFTANTDGSTVGMVHYGTNQSTTKPTIYISTDGRNFSEWDYSTITLANNGDKVWMYGDNPNGIGITMANYSSFTMTGSIAASGDVTTILNSLGQTVLTSSDCLRRLFDSCTVLTVAPELPATTLSDLCYYGMFNGCTSLTSAPELPATTLAMNCYYYMFNGCTGLTSGVDLRHVTTVNQYCCKYMYNGCNNLSVAYTPSISSWTDSCFANWLSGVAGDGTLYKPSDLTVPSGTSGIPSGWSVENYV